MPLKVSRHPHPLAAEVAVGVLLLVMLHHVQVKLVLEVEQLLTDVTLELGANLVFGSDVNITPSSLGESLFTNCTLKLATYLYHILEEFVFFWMLQSDVPKKRII